MIRFAGCALLLCLAIPTPAAAQSDDEPCAVAKPKKSRGLSGLLGSIARGVVQRGADAAGVPSVYGARSSVEALLTDFIACKLEPKERKQAAAATADVLERGDGASARWDSSVRPGVSGSSTVMASSRLADGTQCRDVRDVATIDGEEQTITKRMCRAPGAAGYTVQARA